MLRRVSRTMATIVALSAVVMVSQAGAADKLKVMGTDGTTTVFSVTDSGQVLFPSTAGKGASFSNAGTTLSNFGLLSVNADQSVTNAGAALQMVPRGTGFNANIKAQLTVFGTDFIADSTNYEALVLRATGSAYSINATRAGNGLVRPIQFQMSNQARMTLDTTGYLGIGTTTPKSPLAVVGLPVFENNAAALTGPPALVPGDFYRTSTGQLMVVY